MADRGGMARNRILTAVLCVAGFVHVPAAVAGEPAAGQTGGFRYSDDWKIVSAPPPPGPYETVNVDPRVPGQDVARPVPQEYMVNEPAARMPADPEQLPPPAAGRPLLAPASPAMPGSGQAYQPSTSGAQSRPGYGMPASRYSKPGYSRYQGRQAYPGYGYDQGYGQGYGQSYGRGYTGPLAPSRQQEIPPPPYAAVPGR